MRARRSALLAFLFMNATGAAQTTEPMPIVLRATAAAHGALVRLGDIAELPLDPLGIRGRIENLSVGLAPQRGGYKTLDAEAIRGRLREVGVRDGIVRVLGAEQTTVWRGEIPRDAALPAQAGEIAAASGTARGERALERRSRLRHEAPTPVRDAPSSTSRPREGLGATEQRLVRKGAPVIIRRASKALILEEPGRALGEGVLGESVEVENQRTKQKSLARVIAPGVVLAGEPFAAPEPFHDTPGAHDESLPARVEALGGGPR